jgi:hypothetical protein
MQVALYSRAIPNSQISVSLRENLRVDVQLRGGNYFALRYGTKSTKYKLLER